MTCEDEFLIDLNFGEGVHQYRVISINRIRVRDKIADSQFIGDRWGMDIYCDGKDKSSSFRLLYLDKVLLWLLTRTLLLFDSIDE